MANTKSTSKTSSNKNSSTKTTTTTSTKKGSVMPTTSTKTVTPTTKTTTTSTKNSSTPYAVGTAANGWTMMSNWTVVWGKSTTTTSNNNAKVWAWSTVWTNVSSPVSTVKANTSSAGYVSSKNNWNWTTTYYKSNWDSWTENSKWQVVSKVVNWAGMSVAPTTTSSSSPSNKTSTSSSNKTTSPTTSILWGVGTNYLNTFTNNISWAITSSYKTKNASWSPAVATQSDWSIRYADGSTYNPKTWTTTKATWGTTTSATKTTSTANVWWTVASNWYKSWDYTKTNEKWVQAVSQWADGSIRYADGSTYNPNTNKTTAPTKSTSTVKTNTVSTTPIGGMSTVNKSYDYRKENANGSIAVSEWADWTIRYADGSVYNPKTGQTTDSKGNVVKSPTQSTQVTEESARAAADARANNTSSTNSTNYNNVSSNTSKNNVNNTKTNQDALSMILKNQKDNPNWWGETSYQSAPLSTGTNRTIASQESAHKNDDGSVTYIAPNGKQYTIAKDWDGNLMFNSQWWDSKWDWVNLNDENGNIINDVKEIAKYIKENNKEDWINRSNVDNKDAIKWAVMIWTYNAPSGKEYDILEGTWPNEWKVWFVNIKWETQWFDSQDKALDYIDARNPVWNSDMAKNTPKEEWRNTVSDSITDMNEKLEEREETQDESLENLREELMAELEKLRDESDDTYDTKNNIITSMFNDIDTFDRDINDAIWDLQEKSKLLEDNERMRWARQRAAELAAQWYLTSEQVAQVANYSLSDYNKELEANALEAAKAIAELRVNIAQKKQDYINAIRTQQFANENDRQTQINYISEKFDKILNWIQEKENNIKQFYGSLYNSNLAMNAQNELGYESIIKQNQAQNIANDQNQQRAFTDTEYRRQYILNNITDANLHAYANQAINYLISQWNFIKPWLSNNENKTLLANQISKITDAARQLQLQDTKSLSK